MSRPEGDFRWWVGFAVVWGITPLDEKGSDNGELLVTRRAIDPRHTSGCGSGKYWPVDGPEKAAGRKPGRPLEACPQVELAPTEVVAVAESQRVYPPGLSAPIQ